MTNDALSAEIDGFLKRLFPLSRSLTGGGNRETLRVLQEIAPIELNEYSSGTSVYDWVIPDEWSIRDAYIKGPDGERLIDFKVSNLHVVGYSEPVHEQMKEANKSYPNLRSFSGFKQKQITYSRQRRTHGEPKQTLRRLITDGLNALFSNTYLPIRFFTAIGLLFTIFFIVIGVIVAGVRITGIEFWIFRDIPGTQMVLLAVLAFGALQITFLGVLGEYIARIYEENRGRPYYLIDEIKRLDGK